MQVILTFLASMLTKTFASMAARFGLQTALTAALITVWIALVASLTAATNICFGPTGACATTLSDTSGLSDYFLFGLSLVPSEAITILECLVSLHVAAWAALALWRVVKWKHAASSKGLMVR